MVQSAVPLIASPALAAGEASLRRRAWLMVFMAMVGTMCCSTSVILINVGVFMKPLAGTFHWSRGAISLSLSIGALAMAGANPFVGRLIDRYGVRPILIASLVGYGAATAAIPLLVDGFGIWGLYVGYALVAGVGAGSNVIAYVRILSGWFSGAMNDSRGLALGISAAGVALGGAVSGPLGVELIQHLGWRGGYWGLACLPLVIGLPLAMFAIRTAPHDGGGGPGDARQPVAQGGHSVAEAMRTRAFWLLIAIVLLMSSCLQGLGIHTAPLLSDFGVKGNALATVLGVVGILGVVGRVGAGFLFDRFFAPRISVFIFGLAVLSAWAMAAIPNVYVAIGAVVLITLGSGAESDLVGFLVGRYFGLKSYGQLFGIIYGAFMVGIALGPYLFGVAFDAWGSYHIPFIIAGAGLALLCALLMAMPRFPQPQTLEAPSPA
jgi:MFS family permease